MAKRSKRPRRKTKFEVKEIKTPTVVGALLGGISFISVIAIICVTFQRGGEATMSFAFAGMLTTLFSVVGLVLSILCMNDQYQYHGLGWFGMITNGLALLSMAGILYLGML